jgi:hypothetical protein
VKPVRLALPNGASIAMCSGWLSAFVGSFLFFFLIRMLARLIGGFLVGCSNFRAGFQIGQVDGEVFGLAEFASSSRVIRQMDNVQRAENDFGVVGVAG